MRNKAYLIAFNKDELTSKWGGNQLINVLHEGLINDKEVINWWHYLEGIYIIIVRQQISANQVSNFIRELIPQKQFIVLDVNLKGADGWLPQEAWDWLNPKFH